MNSPRNRRKNERFDCKKSILHNTRPTDWFQRGKVLNYSRNGLYFESSGGLQEEDEISLLVKRRTHGKIDVLDVKIVWRHELRDSLFEAGYGARLQRKRQIDIK